MIGVDCIMLNKPEIYVNEPEKYLENQGRPYWKYETFEKKRRTVQKNSKGGPLRLKTLFQIQKYFKKTGNDTRFTKIKFFIYAETLVRL